MEREPAIPRRDENSLHLVGDGDDVDILYNIEAAFDVTISDEEAENLFTLGQLHDLLVSKLNASDTRRSACVTAVSFYRLRRALIEITGKMDICPATRLDRIFPGGRIGRNSKEIEKHTGMRLPQSELGGVASLLLLIVFFGTPVIAALSGFFLIGDWGWAVLLVWLVIVPLLRFAPYRAPARCIDVGSLTKAMAGLNHGLLSTGLGVNHRYDVWNALVEVIKDYTGGDRPLDRETTFIPSSK